MRTKTVHSSLGIFVLMFDPDGVVGSEARLVLLRYDPDGVVKREQRGRYNPHMYSHTPSDFDHIGVKHLLNLVVL